MLRSEVTGESAMTNGGGKHDDRGGKKKRVPKAKPKITPASLRRKKLQAGGTPDLKGG